MLYVVLTLKWTNLIINSTTSYFDRLVYKMTKMYKAQGESIKCVCLILIVFDKEKQQIFTIKKLQGKFFKFGTNIHLASRMN